MGNFETAAQAKVGELSGSRFYLIAIIISELVWERLALPPLWPDIDNLALSVTKTLPWRVEEGDMHWTSLSVDHLKVALGW